MAARKKAKKKVAKKKTKKKVKKKVKKKSTKAKPGDKLGGKKSQAVVLTDAQRKDLRNGNSFWMLRSSHGRKPIFKKPEDLFDACTQYFKACDDNPLQEEKVFAYKGFIEKENVSKMRAMTIQGLCIFIGINRDTWSEYRKKDNGFSVICSTVEEIMYNQKLTGASADLLNASIIARHLGLKDHQDHSSKDGSMSTQPLTKKQKELLEKVQDDEY